MCGTLPPSGSPPFLSALSAKTDRDRPPCRVCRQGGEQALQATVAARLAGAYNSGRGSREVAMPQLPDNARDLLTSAVLADALDGLGLSRGAADRLRALGRAWLFRQLSK